MPSWIIPHSTVVILEIYKHCLGHLLRDCIFSYSYLCANSGFLEETASVLGDGGVDTGAEPCSEETTMISFLLPAGAWEAPLRRIQNGRISSQGEIPSRT